MFATKATLATPEVEGVIAEWTGPDAGEELNGASAEEKALNGVSVSFFSEEDLQGAAHESQPCAGCVSCFFAHALLPLNGPQGNVKC